MHSAFTATLHGTLRMQKGPAYVVESMETEFAGKIASTSHPRIDPLAGRANQRSLKKSTRY